MHPEDAFLVRTWYWNVKDNEAGDVMDERIAQPEFVKSARIIDMDLYTRHVYHTLQNFCNHRLRNKIDPTLGRNKHNIIRRVIHQMDICASSWKAYDHAFHTHHETVSEASPTFVE